MLDCTGAHSFAADRLPVVDRLFKAMRSGRVAAAPARTEQIDIRCGADRTTQSSQRLEREADHCASAGILPVEMIT